jgi:hypothetical protein
LHLQYSANSGPTVIFEWVLARFSLEWVLVQAEIWVGVKIGNAARDIGDTSADLTANPW